MSSDFTSPRPPSHDVPYAERAFPFAVACRVLGVCENTGRALVRKGLLESFRIGKRHLVTGRAIRAFQDAAAKAQRRAVRS
ncbi:helix-turn-helix domain-containing protein [Bradyrhizobium cosmicum]|uniref:Helix-turn-helix domain-containing protein n=1 Tax=Bradyrhizobium cosmicum TaxID=1404864 RepID=A0AAI8QA09_9BRAD|nr:hypothetical protein S23_05280 [Bradyrhizobium cosmicum]